MKLIQQFSNEKQKLDLKLTEEQLVYLDCLARKDAISIFEWIEIIRLQREDGSFPLVVDKDMPSDCYYYYVKKPTYLALCILAKVYTKYHTDEIRNIIIHGLDFCNQFNLKGHGYTATREQILNVLIFLKSGVYDIADESFKEKINNIIQVTREQIDSNKTSFGFGDWSMEAKYLIEYVDNSSIQ